MTDMSATVSVLVITVALAVQFWSARHLNPVTGTLLRLQAVFWLVAFVARPVYLISTTPGRTELLGDYRLAALGYESTLGRMMSVVALCQMAFSLGLIVYTRTRNKNIDKPTKKLALSDDFTLFRLAAIFLVIGWLGRILGLLDSVSLSTVLAPFAGVGACVMVVFGPRSSARLVLGLVAVSELSWAIIGATKTPLLAILTAYLIRSSLKLSYRSQLKRVPIIITVVIATFVVIQPLKGIDTFDQLSSGDSSATSAPLEAVAVTVMQRTDLISSVTDGYLYPYSAWMSDSEFLQNVALAAIPKLGIFEYENQGLRWTREVRSATFANQFQDVSLASGPIAEGMAMGGKGRSVIGMLVLLLLTVVVGRMLLSRSIPVVIAGSMFAFDSSLYESGILGNAESATKALQMAIVAMILTPILKSSPPQKAPPRLVDTRVGGVER